MAMTEDFNVFFNEDEHADEFHFIKDGASRTVVGIFEAPYDDQVGIGSSAPTILAPESEARKVGPGWSTEHKSRVYRVRGPIQPDGTGLATIVLEDRP